MAIQIIKAPKAIQKNRFFMSISLEAVGISSKTDIKIIKLAEKLALRIIFFFVFFSRLPIKTPTKVARPYKLARINIFVLDMCKVKNF